MASREQLRAVLAQADTAGFDRFFKACIAALDHDLATEVIAAASAMADGPHRNSPKLWQILGLAQRSLQESGAAFTAFGRAAALAPADRLIAHSHARTALEAGYPAAALFDRALELSPGEPALIQAQSAAMLAEGDRRGAARLLEQALRRDPSWLDGHRTLAKVRAMTGSNEAAMASLRAALQRDPRSFPLWATMIGIALQADDYVLALRCIEAARVALGSHPEFDRVEAICLSETGDAAAAQRIFARMPDVASAAVTIHPLRNLIRLRRFDEAERLAARPLRGPDDLALWPYRALLWRLSGDPRWEWLEGRPEMIASFDLAEQIAPIDELAELLRALHATVGRPIDQSVRGGSQTDGNLLARAELPIRRLRAALLDAVATYVAQLPPPEPGHPTLLAQRRPLQVEGAWSVRLTDGGFHVDHVHQHGWISSALYVSLPDGEQGIGPSQDESGWLKFGEAQSLVPELKAFRSIEPKVGKLVLFPSTTWHGTRPFGAGERMSVAFDIARPRQ